MRADTRTDTLYDRDYYAWAVRNAELLRAGRLAEADIEHVAEELEDMGKSERRALESQVQRIMVHLLKVRYQPARRTRSWDLSIAEARERLGRTLRDNPSLRGEVPALVLDIYKLARLRAARQTKLELDVFPVECPFTAAEILG